MPGINLPGSAARPSGVIPRPQYTGGAAPPQKRPSPNDVNGGNIPTGPPRAGGEVPTYRSRQPIARNAVTNRPPQYPFKIPVEVSAVTSIPFIYRLVFGQEPDQQRPGEGVMKVDPSLVPPPIDWEAKVRDPNFQRALEIARQRQSARDFFGQIGEFFLGKSETTGLGLASGGGFVAKNISGGIGKVILGAGEAGSGEEAAIARMNAETAARRAALAEILLTGLRFTPAFSGGGPDINVEEMWRADP